MLSLEPQPASKEVDGDVLVDGESRAAKASLPPLATTLAKVRSKGRSNPTPADPGSAASCICMAHRLRLALLHSATPAAVASAFSRLCSNQSQQKHCLYCPTAAWQTYYIQHHCIVDGRQWLPATVLNQGRLSKPTGAGPAVSISCMTAN